MDKKEKITFEKFMDKVETYIKNEEELKLITKAYSYAYEKHFGVKRLTGEEYIEHPLSVAYILTGINADVQTLAAALLHDVLEDCEVTKEEMEKEFGSEITNIVLGVTKLNKLNFSGDNEAVIANHRKIIVGLSEDVRVIILKLADRLNNMRTLWVHSEKKQKEIAKETLDILTPIAHRLGMNQIKSELEDLSLRYYKPDVYFSIVENLNKTRKERDNIVNEMVNQVSHLLLEHGIKNEVKGRAKSIYSIYKKLDKGKKFSDIYDLMALRVYVESEQECYQALGILHSKYKPIPKRFKDYIAMPKTNMYQSLHSTVFGPESNLFEVQMRTYDMDKIAEHGIASHWSYKEGKSGALQNTMEQKLQFFRSIIELKSEDSNDEEFVNSVKEDIFKDTIYVFTPKGDVVELPAGATPIDFAYKVHSQVGDKMVSAIVNNVIVPLDYSLKDNDIIKINTNNNSLGPNKEWLNIVKTTQARNKIKSFFSKNDREIYLKKGEEMIAKELRKRKIPYNEFFTNETVEKLLNEFKLQNQEEIFISIGSNRFPVSHLINTINNENETKEEMILKKSQNNDVAPTLVKNDIIVRGIDDIKVNIASCCKPIPEDRIMGYITKGYGITVHRMVCPNVADLTERTIDVEWNSEIHKKYPTSILVYSTSTENLLLDIISKTSNFSISVQNFNAINTSENFLYEITLLVENKTKLLKFINEISTIKNVIDVERAIK